MRRLGDRTYLLFLIADPDGEEDTKGVRSSTTPTDRSLSFGGLTAAGTAQGSAIATKTTDWDEAKGDFITHW